MEAISKYFKPFYEVQEASDEYLVACTEVMNQENLNQLLDRNEIYSQVEKGLLHLQVEGIVSLPLYFKLNKFMLENFGSYRPDAKQLSVLEANQFRKLVLEKTFLELIKK